MAHHKNDHPCWMDAITTGVFQVPANNPGGTNEVINVVLENPSSKTLTVYWVFEASDIVDYGINSPVATSAPFKIVVAPHSTQMHALSAQSPGSLADFLFRFIFWGDIDLEEKKNKLSIEILAGTSTSSSLTSAKLSSGDASVLFRHENFLETKFKKDADRVPLQGNSITIL
ncbi:hypothetical protein HPY31_21280 [Brevibacillus sp. HB1.3]|uniref:hypothetical protein n=1 Tax=Brevibacillus sp. HB1.3 TaxID=2738842 RepID=UPI0015554914|nr:hypothetical protein [Brevibacillus sp. HB1.3]NQF16412.1 hypothetical protein [Brevibacillus sp. HB1.3]